MSIRCNLIGHKFDESEIQERKETKKDCNVLAEVKISTCARCGATDETRLKTKILDKEDNIEKQNNNNNKQTETESMIDSIDENNRTKNSNNKDFNNFDEIEYQKSNDGKILENDTETETTQPINDIVYPDEVNHQDEGVILLEENKKSRTKSASKNNSEMKINCESCTFTSYEVKPTRRDGDMCPECGGWLKITKIKSS